MLQHNHLLAALPEGDLERLTPHLKRVSLSLGEALYESGVALQYVFFPVDSIISLLSVMSDGASAEIAVVGNDGVVGIALFMGGDTTPSRGVVQSAGYAYRLEGELLKAEFNRGAAMHRVLLRYTQALLTQMAQTAVCNRHHSLDQQLCRWLLISLDRQYARRASRGRHGSRRQTAAGQSDPLQPRPNYCAGSRGT
jgi:hypothetical protein